MKKSAESLPDQPGCPFCGEPWQNCSIDEIALGDKKPFAVCCDNCGAIGPRARTPEEANKKWNRRK